MCRGTRDKNVSGTAGGREGVSGRRLRGMALSFGLILLPKPSFVVA